MDLKLIILFLLIIIFTSLYLVKLYRTKSNYFTLSQAQDIFNNPNYITHFSHLDRQLRNCGNNNAECLSNYTQSVLELSKLEKEMLDTIVLDFRQLLRNNFKNIFKEIKFIKVKNNIENGMPHTRNRAIVFSQRYFKSMLDDYLKNSHFLSGNTYLLRLLSHEQFHIFQRYNSSKIENFYLTKWKLEKLSNDLPLTIKEINRTNPDALPNNNWLFQTDKNKYILPLCVYNSKDSVNINDTSNIYLNVIKNKKGKFIFPQLEKQIEKKNLLSEHQEFSKFFGYQGANNYHPHEISASLFEDIVLDTIRKNKDNEEINNKLNSPAYKLLQDFL